jgi:hypothetical protein
MKRIDRALRLAISLVGLAACAPTKTPPALLTWDVFNATTITTPLIVEYTTPEGALLYVGVEHTNDPRDRQLQRLMLCWNAFRPTIAFTEGGVRPPMPTAAQAVRENGEAGLVRSLADDLRIPIQNIDADAATELDFLLIGATPEQVKVFITLRQLGQAKREDHPSVAGDWNKWANRWLAEKNNVNSHPAAIANALPRNAEELQRSVETLGLATPGQLWHELPADLVLPTKDVTFTHKLARRSTELRDTNMIRTLRNTLNKPNRVFAVVGAGHIVMQGPMLQRTFGQPQTPDCAR